MSGSPRCSWCRRLLANEEREDCSTCVDLAFEFEFPPPSGDALLLLVTSILRGRKWFVAIDITVEESEEREAQKVAIATRVLQAALLRRKRIMLLAETSRYWAQRLRFLTRHRSRIESWRGVVSERIAR